MASVPSNKLTTNFALLEPSFIQALDWSEETVVLFFSQDLFSHVNFGIYLLRKRYILSTDKKMPREYLEQPEIDKFVVDSKRTWTS